MRKTKKMQSIGLYGFSIFWAIVTLVPLFFTLLSSLKKNEDIFYEKMFRLPEKLQFHNYKLAMTDAHMGRAIVNSLFLTTASTAILLVVVCMAAYVLSRYTFRLNPWIYLYFIIGFMIPIHSTLIPLMKLISDFKAQNSYLTMILLYVSFQLPVAIFLITGFMKEISKEIDEAAKIDGCGPVRLLFTILIPLCAPIISTTAIIAYLYIYNDLIFAVMFLTKQEMYTISVAMMTFVGLRTVEMGPIFACIIIAIIPMLIVYIVLQEKVVSGLTAGAVKG